MEESSWNILAGRDPRGSSSPSPAQNKVWVRLCSQDKRKQPQAVPGSFSQNQQEFLPGNCGQGVEREVWGPGARELSCDEEQNPHTQIVLEHLFLQIESSFKPLSLP